MAVKSVIVYWPWGAGGNLVKNICTLDTDFDWFDQEPYRAEVAPAYAQRVSFMMDYYTNSVGAEGWLEREWSVRTKYLAKYYDNNCITYWDTACATAYECHGSAEEIDRILDPAPLQIYDRTRVCNGEISEQLSDWSLADRRHVFLLPQDLHLITDIYQSKNPQLNQIDQVATVEARRSQVYTINQLMSLRLQTLATMLTEQGQRVYKYTADQLFADTGDRVLAAIVQDLDLTISPADVVSIHQAWWANTQQVYQQYWNQQIGNRAGLL
jgi:hypothetical protein